MRSSVYLVVALCACQKSPVVDTRTVALHFSAACASPKQGYAAYYARGDFQPDTSHTAEDEAFLRDVGQGLDALPAETRALLVDVTDTPDGEWLGAADVPASGDVDVLLWPAAGTCRLTPAFAPVDRPATLALDGRRLLVVGGLSTDATVPVSWRVDLATGKASALPTGPRVVRAGATLTRFGDGALLAGGVRSDDPNGVVGTAEVWSATLGDFDGAPITLGLARANHAAVELVTGETLLVGGTDDRGNVFRGPALVKLDRTASAQGLPLLEPRVRPTALRLASGEILVAGGQDAKGAPVGLLEVLAPDGRALVRRLPFVARKRQAFVALDGGGALAVIAPDPTDPAEFVSVWRISSDGAPTALDPKPALTDPRLFRGANGGAVLFTGTRWLSFDPWAESLTAMSDGEGPSAEAISPEPGVGVWLARDGDVARLAGRRWSIRNAFATELRPLAAAALGPLTPDRSPDISGMTFDPGRGLALPEGATVMVADGRYGAVRIDVDLVSGAAPGIVLRAASGATFEVGGTDCPVGVTAPATLHVVRAGAYVTVAVGDALALPCPHTTTLERVAVGLRGHASVVRNLVVARPPIQ